MTEAPDSRGGGERAAEGRADASWPGAIRERARQLGFQALGFARADVPLEPEHSHYRAFVAAGMHGSMNYLADNAAVRARLDSEQILRGARTVVCLARRYDRGPAAEANDPPLAHGIARYARGRDYHGHLRKKLQKLAAFVRALRPGSSARALCDTAPVLERAWAARAGLGFVGKNGLLIVPGQGSYCLLGEIVTTLALPASSYGQPMRERCGSCRACLDVCPTQAFPQPFVLDARRCLAYWTIESRSAAPAEIAAAVGDHLFGCDDCQDVCPYNRIAPPPASATEPYEPLPRWHETTLLDFVNASADSWDERSRGTPLRRATRAGMARNAIMVAAVRRRRGRATPQDEAVLTQAAKHDEPWIRELAEDLLAEDLTA